MTRRVGGAAINWDRANDKKRHGKYRAESRSEAYAVMRAAGFATATEKQRRYIRALSSELKNRDRAGWAEWLKDRSRIDALSKKDAEAIIDSIKAALERLDG